MKRVLTVPSVMQRHGERFLTGNHYVSLPRISGDGTINTVAFLSGRLNALLEFNGEIRPYISIDGEGQRLAAGEYRDDFIPCFSGSCRAATYSLEYVAEEERRGVVCCFTVRAEQRVELRLGFEINISEVLRSIFHSYPMEGRIKLLHYKWTDTLICECLAGGSYGGFGIGCDDAQLGADGIYTSLSLDAGEEQSVLMYLAVGAETDGIGLNAMDMRRRGMALVRAQRERLRKRHISISDKALERYANFNLNFCYYFSAGRTIDGDELCLVTSKSSDYYVSAAFWSRDCYLWAFPALLRADAGFAREALLAGFSRYIKNIGIHALYIDGTVLYPGFELDEQAAPVIALKRYVEHTGDSAILEQEPVKTGLRLIKEVLMKRYDVEYGLFTTELDPSDDPVIYKFNTYDNALCSVALDYMGQRELSESVRDAIYRHCTVLSGGRRIFAYSAERGEQRIYDDPPGSLMLLPYYGFCTADDGIWRNTAEFIYSSQNPYYYENGELLGAGCEHTPYPWSISLINRILGCGRAEERVLGALRAVSEAYPLVTESFSLSDGGMNTGDAFATMAGFIANGIFEAYKN